MQAQADLKEKAFAQSEGLFAEMVAELESTEAIEMTHSLLESKLEMRGRDLLRQMYQDHLDLRAAQEITLASVTGSDSNARTHRRQNRTRKLMTVFGPVTVRRTAYDGCEMSQLCPADASLNLPRESYSHVIRRRTAVEVSKASFEEAGQSIDMNTGGHVPKRQVEELAARAAQDFDAFYDDVSREPSDGEILALSVDGKGIAVRQEDLREATRKKAETTTHKLEKRLSKGEKKNAKRMATVAAVYSIAPFVRAPEDIIRDFEPVKVIEKRPRPENKRIWASLQKPSEEVITEMFIEADVRDPDRDKRWVVLVDGHEHQMSLLEACRDLDDIPEFTIILDVVHVIEYLWKAALAFHGEASPEAEAWVKERLLRILQGKSSAVAAGIRRSATLRALKNEARKPVDKCADYLLKNASYLRYNEYLADGLPIATGVVEGACRYFKDRMEVTGARWSLSGAESILKLRAIRASGDFDEYWAYHEEREFERNHLVFYEGAPPRTQPSRKGRHLRVVK